MAFRDALPVATHLQRHSWRGVTTWRIWMEILGVSDASPIWYTRGAVNFQMNVRSDQLIATPLCCISDGRRSSPLTDYHAAWGGRTFFSHMQPNREDPP
jgi:hypothetical protein